MNQDKFQIEDTTDEEDIEIEIEDSEDEDIKGIDEDYEDPLSYDVSSIQESSTSSTLTEELKILGDDVFKGEKFKRYEEATKESIPATFVFIINNEVVNLIKLYNKSKNIIENYNMFIDKKIKLNPKDFILLFYIVNKDRSKKYLIENLNKIRELAEVEEYFIEAFDDYKSFFEKSIKFRLEKNKEDFEELKNFYSKIEKFKTTDKYNDILETFSVDTTKSIFSIKDGDYFFDKENTRIIFDKIEVNSFFSYARLDDEKESFYKIYTGGDKKYENFLEFNDTVSFEKNRLYLFYELNYRNRNVINYIMINFDTSKCEINYYENTLDFILNRLREIFPELEIIEKQDTDLSGDFEITIDNFSETKLYYLTLFSDIFSEFIFIREDSSVRSMKENIKYYYVGSDQLREYLNYSSFFYIKKLYNNRYLIKYTSKSTSAKIIKEFILILSKLFWFYNNLPSNLLNYLSIVEQPYTGVDGEGLGGNVEDMTDVVTSIKTRKIENLQKADPDLFQKRLYVRTCPCQKQPIIIPKEDKEDWEKYEVDGKKRNVVLFPPEKSKQKVSKNYYVCPDDEFSNFSLRENPDSSSLYPLIPCCNVSNFPKDLYEDYDEIRENPSKYWASKERHRGKGVGILKTLKILTAGRKGILMDYVVNFLSVVEKGNYIREGVRKNSKSSFLHCIFRGIINYKLDLDVPVFKNIRKLINSYNDSSEERKEDKIAKFRNFLGEFKEKVNLAVSMQELYDHSLPEIFQLIKNPSLNLDSNKFFRFFEIFFMINIFVFVFDKENDTTYLETPNHQYYHIRIVNDKLPCLFILKHKRKYSYDVYEIIRRKDSEEPYLFSPKFSKYMKQYILDNNIYYIRKENKLRKNCFSVLNWDVILKDYTFKYQALNSSGRMFFFTFQASPKEDDLISVFTESSPPIFCKTGDDIYFTKKKRCIKLFGEKYTEGSRGLWYPVNDIELGFFIPCSDIKEKDNLVCKDFEIILGKSIKNRELENIEICKENSNIYLQLIKWLYLLEDVSVEKWFQKNVIEDKKMKEESLVYQKFKIPYRFPSNVTTSKEGIKYLSQYISEIFDKNNSKIYLYPKLYNSTKRNLINFEKANKDLVIPNRKTLTGILNSEKDFQKYDFNKILIDNDFNYWEDNIMKEKQQITEIEEDYVSYKLPFIFKNDNTQKIYMIQNTVESSLTVSLVICKLYQLFDNNIFYDITLKTLWGVIKQYYNRYNFGWTFEKLKSYIASKLDRELYFRNEIECLDFLIKNKIVFRLEDKFSYIVYTKMNNKVSVTNKYIIDKETPLELYSFSTGAYASMLPII